MKIIISDDELKERMKPPLSDLIEGDVRLPKVITPPELGRPEGAKNIDPITRELIALDGAFGSLPQTSIARVHNVAQSEVSFLSKGYDRTNVDERKVDENLQTSITQRKFGIIDTATTKLMETLDLFDPNYIEQKQLPEAANKIASVVERLEGRGNINQNAPSVQFHVYAPRTRHEDQYEVIVVNE